MLRTLLTCGVVLVALVTAAGCFRDSPEYLAWLEEQSRRGDPGDACDGDTSCAGERCDHGVCCEQGACCAADHADHCRPYACNGVFFQCELYCGSGVEEDDGRCATGHHCDDGDCVADLDHGAACDEGGDCQSGHCAAEICCAAGRPCCRGADDCELPQMPICTETFHCAPCFEENRCSLQYPGLPICNFDSGACTESL